MNILRTPAAALAVGTAVSRLLGFLRVVILAHTIGIAGSVGADMFGLANQLPNTIYTIVAGGTLNAVLVPQIVRAVAKCKDGGQAYVDKLLTLSLAVLAVVTAVAVAAAPGVVAVFARGEASERSAAFGLAVAFAFWCLPQIFFYGVFTMLGEVLNARGIFGPFAWAPAVNNVIAVCGLLVFAGVFGVDVHRPADEWTMAQVSLLAGSTTAGVVAQAVTLVLFWHRTGLTFTLDFRWRKQGFRGAGRTSGWVAMLVVLTQVAGILQTNVALLAVGGSVAALQTAWLLFMLPHSVITVSLATAVFPRMSRHGVTGSGVELWKDFVTLAHRCLVPIGFCSVVLIAAAIPVSRFFASDAGEARQLGVILVAYAVGGLAFCLAFIAQRVFYAQSNTRTPFFLGVLQLAVFCLLMMAVSHFSPRGSIAAGIAMASSASFVVQAAASLFALSRRWCRDGDGRVLFGVFVRSVGAGVVALSAGLLIVVRLGALGDGFAVSGIAPAFLTTIFVALVVGLLYFSVLLLAKDTVAKQLVAGLRSKWEA